MFRRACIDLSMLLHSDFAFFMRLPLETLAQTIEDTVKEVGKLGRKRK